MSDDAITNAVIRAAQSNGGGLSCPNAFKIVRRLGATPAQVGAAADAVDIRVYRCQLGLFGYGSKAEGNNKLVQAVNPVPPALAAQLRAALDAQGNLSCVAAWEVAHRARIGRLAVADAAEGLGLRITDCQLGCFKKRSKS